MIFGPRAMILMSNLGFEDIIPPEAARFIIADCKNTGLNAHEAAIKLFLETADFIVTNKYNLEVIDISSWDHTFSTLSKARMVIAEWYRKDKISAYTKSKVTKIIEGYEASLAPLLNR